MKKAVSGSGHGSEIKEIGFSVRMQADIFNIEVATMNLEKGSAAGVTILAAVGFGAFSSVEEACSHIVRTANTTEPISENVKRYDAYYEAYRSLYRALKERYAKQFKTVDAYL
jgi:xylulokinase